MHDRPFHNKSPDKVPLQQVSERHCRTQEVLQHWGHSIRGTVLGEFDQWGTMNPRGPETHLFVGSKNTSWCQAERPI